MKLLIYGTKVGLFKILKYKVPKRQTVLLLHLNFLYEKV